MCILGLQAGLGACINDALCASTARLTLFKQEKMEMIEGSGRISHHIHKILSLPCGIVF